MLGTLYVIGFNFLYDSHTDRCNDIITTIYYILVLTIIYTLIIRYLIYKHFSFVYFHKQNPPVILDNVSSYCSFTTTIKDILVTQLVEQKWPFPRSHENACRI